MIFAPFPDTEKASQQLWPSKPKEGKFLSSKNVDLMAKSSVLQRVSEIDPEIHDAGIRDPYQALPR